MNPSPKPRPPFSEPAYAAPSSPHPIDLRLDRNEGRGPDQAVVDALQGCDSAALRQYPSCRGLESDIATRFGIAAERVVVTAGGDDAIQRLCRAFLGPGRSLVVPTPTFEMIPRIAGWEGAPIVTVDWHGPRYPTDAVLQAAKPQTRMVAMVSPNNPTGGWATSDDLIRVSQALPHAVVMVDAAYAEFGDANLTETALTLPNAVVLRTFSKAQGLAGLRIGYAMGPEPLINAMRSAGLPYPVSQPSILMARSAFGRGTEPPAYVDAVVAERRLLAETLTECGWNARPSQGNFVFAQGPDERWFQEAMAAMGIAIRCWPDSSELAGSVRITCPGDAADFTRVTSAIRTALQPEAILFDMDGVLADVTRSYRTAIIETVNAFGGHTTPSAIEQVKQSGDANNDWRVTQRILASQGIDADLSAVQSRFDGLYNGDGGIPGLHENETLIGTADDLRALRERVKLAVVTGRPRLEAERFLIRFGIESCFDVLVTADDAPSKPSPEPVRLAMSQLGVRHAWMIGDTPDDLVAARSASALPIGICGDGPSADAVGRSLAESGAARTLTDWTDIRGVLP